MPIPDEYQQIVKDILSLTRQTRIPWKEGPTGWIFLASFRGLSVRVEDSGENEGVEFTFALLNNQGKDVDSFAVTRGEGEGFSTLRELWKLANRQVLRVDEAVAALRHEITSLAEDFAIIIGSLRLEKGQSGSVDLRAVNAGQPGLGAWSIDIIYQPTLVAVVGCVAKQDGVCNAQFSNEAIRIVGANSSGLTGDINLATISFKRVKEGTSPLRLKLDVFADASPGGPQDLSASVTLRDGSIVCPP